ncbi:MAG TPA: 3-hydroxyacyl-CoA dehydrogenase [Rhizobiales bacterium]|nr:3-hydroxyacyl-CoA dehydrogenase [Hyphomicrobiales bacterium]
MTYKNFTVETDRDGVCLVSWDMPEKSMNVIDMSVMDDLENIIALVAEDDSIKGAVITSAKKDFCAGADLTMLGTMAAEYVSILKKDGEAAATSYVHDEGARLGKILRKMETCGKPFAAAINGTALGGGFEITLACHHRVAASDTKGKLGLPESRVGLLPGAGGTQRLPRLVGAQDALQLMLQGRHIDAAKALRLGAVHALAPSDGIVDAARRWIIEDGNPVAPWDEKGFRVPGGVPYSAKGMMMWMAANAMYRQQTYDNYDAQRAIMKCVYEGLCVKTIDAGLAIEGRYFTSLLKGSQSKNMIRSLFVSMQELGKGARRPKDVPPSRVKKLGVIGAGFMGAGIAYVSASAGIEVVLVDRDVEAAERGKAHSASLMDKQISRGRASEAAKEKLLGLIAATADYKDLEGCDFVIEAVFENRELKAKVLPDAESRLGKGAILASNTSTLPITGLAEYIERPQDFIGVHFFSPVEKMMLVEIIVGEKTGDEALARALDYVRQIRKTPIVVNDSRGFFTSRVVMTYIAEGHHMLDEGIPAALIENAGRMAGMPVGPLSLNDEVALDLSWKIIQATKADLGDAYVQGPIDRILEEMVVRRERFGRKNAKGFYDYPKGGKKRLWPGISGIAGQKTIEIAADEVKERLLLIQALETARVYEENVLTDPREADVGAILGFGFAPYTGGPLSYIDTIGAKEFVARCEFYEKKYGSRYAPCKLLKDMAAKGDSFYGHALKAA